MLAYLQRIGIVPPIAVPPRWSEIRKADPWQCLQDARAQVRAELGFGEQDIVVGCVAVLREPKGHADLLQAMFGRNGESPVAVLAASSPSISVSWAARIGAGKASPLRRASELKLPTDQSRSNSPA